MNYLPFVIFAVIIVGMLALAARNRRRTALAEVERSERIGVGSDVMTTSGLHGTVVAKSDDGTVTLSIAPGVEVRWELAALRDTASLPDRYVRDDDTTHSVDLDKSDPTT
ncbi:preprotein translocase subunit YajC [uncultured Jatrophihabitans sp.]|uniref:preprotein translocase subunit YajC n=1 Tax=uncultured Jatrophihabitans sp. TaxID=1610747 RepID=UPI0035CAC9F2